MSELRDKYQNALKFERKYRDAPRAGWVEKGSRKKENEAILVRRSEVANLAMSLASAQYSSYSRLYETIALQNILGKYAVQRAGNAPYCQVCHQHFLPEWAEGRCPYCAAGEVAKRQIDELLRGDGQ